MALPSSGTISVSDILAEGGVAAGTTTALSRLEAGSIFTINTASPSYPDGAQPHSLSEWYSYDHSATSWSNSYALDYDGVNDYVRGTVTGHPTQTFSLSFWYRNDASTKVNQFFYSFANTEGSTTTGRFSIFYNASLNRLIVQFFKQISGVNRQYFRAYALHDNSSVTGITNSTTGWTSGQRGNTDSAGFTHIMVCIDQTQSSYLNGIKTYWNGSELTTTATGQNYFTTQEVTPNKVSIGDNVGATAPNSMVNGVLDEMYLYNAQLSASNVSTIYGYGRKTSENTFSTNYYTAWRMENNVNDEEGYSSMTNNGATFITTP